MRKDKESKDWPWTVAMLLLSIVCLFVIEFLKTV
jgi:hypothetical protein